MSAEPKRVDDLAARLADTYIFRDERFAFAEDVAQRVADFGWVSPEEVAAREAAARREAEDDPAHARMYRALVERAERAEAEVATARREALLEAADWIAEAHPNVRGLLCAARDIRGFAEIDVVGMADTIARVEALAEDLESGGYWPPWQALAAGRIRAALAEPERDEEGGR